MVVQLAGQDVKKDGGEAIKMLRRAEMKQKAAKLGIMFRRMAVKQGKMLRRTEMKQKAVKQGIMLAKLRDDLRASFPDTPVLSFLENVASMDSRRPPKSSRPPNAHKARLQV